MIKKKKKWKALEILLLCLSITCEKVHSRYFQQGKISLRHNSFIELVVALQRDIFYVDSETKTRNSDVCLDYLFNINHLVSAREAAWSETSQMINTLDYQGINPVINYNMVLSPAQMYAFWNFFFLFVNLISGVKELFGFNVIYGRN